LIYLLDWFSKLSRGKTKLSLICVGEFRGVEDFRGLGQLTGEQLTTCPSGVVGQICNDTLVRSAVGVGLIWDSPFGPLRFDLAYPLTKQPYDHTQLFRFGGGTKF